MTEEARRTLAWVQISATVTGVFHVGWWLDALNYTGLVRDAARAGINDGYQRARVCALSGATPLVTVPDEHGGEADAYRQGWEQGVLEFDSGHTLSPPA